MPKGDHRRKFHRLATEAEARIAAGQTQEQIATSLGLNRTTVQRWCKRFGWTTQRTGPRAGASHPNWTGGRVKIGRYWYRYQPDHPHATKQRRVAEHRLVVESTLGRYLAPSEVVHHIDGNPEHNAPANLQVFQTNAAHLKVDLAGRVPNWTPNGLEKQAVNRQQIAIRRKSGAYGRGRNQYSGRPPS